MKKYYEVVLRPCAAGFGEWERAGSEGDGYRSPMEILSEAFGDGAEWWTLGVDALPPDVPDIRGRIHDEPRAVYAYRQDDGSIAYFGIEEVDA